MAISDYKYQATIMNQLPLPYSAGYTIFYNIEPDYGARIFPGDPVTITGQLADSSGILPDSLGIELSSDGIVEPVRVQQPVSIDRGEFTVTVTVPELEGDDTRCVDVTVKLCGHAPSPIGNMLQIGITPFGEYEYLSYRLGPKVNLFDAVRCLSDGTADDIGMSARIRLGISLAEGFDQSYITVATLALIHSGETQRTINLPAAAVAAALTSGGYVETEPGVIPEDIIDRNHEWTVRVTIGDSAETASADATLPKAFANLHLSGASTGGVAMGMFSTATEDHPKFECMYPAYFFGGIHGSGGGFAPGDTYSIPAWPFTFNGCITGSRQTVALSLNLGRPIDASVTSVSIAGYICIRGDQGYLSGMSTSGIDVNGNGYTTTVNIMDAEGGIIEIHIVKSSAFSSVTNNTPINAMVGDNHTLTLTFA